MEQPNVTGDGDAPLTPRFWAALVLTGIATGLLGIALMALLFQVEAVAFPGHRTSFLESVRRASDLRRLVVLALAGVIGGMGWFGLRRVTAGERSEVDEAVWAGDGGLSFRRSLGTSVLSEVVIGAGASIGREAAPKLMGGAAGSLLSDRLRLGPAQRRLLVAAGAGAGLGAVYNVPLGGALFAAEILLGSLALPVVLPALACSAVATAVTWLYLPTHATYPNIPAYPFSMAILVWALGAGPLIGVLSSGYIRLIGWVSHHRASEATLLWSMPLAFTVLGLVGMAYPELFGNGQDMAHAAFLGQWGFALLGAVFLLKPLLTALCLGGGATGGLFTPTLSTGAVFGALLGAAWSLAWPGTPTGAFALVGAVAMIGASMQAPLSALALVLELTHAGFALMVPMIVATTLATAVARHVDGYSIYSARLPTL